MGVVHTFHKGTMMKNNVQANQLEQVAAFLEFLTKSALISTRTKDAREEAEAHIAALRSMIRQLRVEIRD